MTQAFHPYRIILALVLSIVLVLHVAQLTQAKTAQYPTHPSQKQAENALAYYYNIIGPFSEKNFWQGVDSITYGPVYGTGTFDRFGACVQYRFSANSSPQVIQTARHIFTFQYDTAPPDQVPPGSIAKGWWDVIRMDVNVSC